MKKQISNTLLIYRRPLTYLSSRLGNGTKVVDEVSLGHTNTSITDAKDLVFFIGSDANVEILLAVEDGRVCEGLIADFVQGIGAVGDEFTQEDLLVAVEGI